MTLYSKPQFLSFYIWQSSLFHGTARWIKRNLEYKGHDGGPAHENMALQMAALSAWAVATDMSAGTILAWGSMPEP